MRSAPDVQPRRKESAGTRRSAILKAAGAVFARQGFANTSIDDIAAEANIGKGTVYLYFDSKGQIYHDAVLEAAGEIVRQSRMAIGSAPDWRQKVRAYVEVRLRFCEARPDFVRLFITEARNVCSQTTSLGAELRELATAGESLLAQALAVAVAQGEIRAVDPDLAAAAVADLTRGLIDRRLLGGRRFDRSDDFEFTVNLVYQALAP